MPQFEEERERSFRAWDKKERRMVYDVGVYAGTVIQSYEHPFNGMKILGHAFSQHLIPMDFVGHEDKNGKKIWEGDIVQYDEPGFSKVTSYFYEVFWDKDRCGFSPFSRDDGCGCCSSVLVSPEEVVVIGNIYENVDLIPR